MQENILVSGKEPLYTIPARYRKMENMHIVFWLLKDVSWCMIWKPLAIAMIFPTLIISIIICYRTRHLKSELAHNLAITFWITANAYWMVSEFVKFDTVHIWQTFEGKHLALIPFTIGVLLLFNYYIFQKPREDRESQVATM
jgi:hypothetical protein